MSETGSRRRRAVQRKDACLAAGAGDGVCNGTTRTRTTRPGSRRLLSCVSAPRARATAISTSRRSRSRSISTQRRRWATAATSSTSHTASVSAVALITFLEGDLLLAPHRAQILQHRSSLFCGVLECAVAERMRPLTIVNIGGSPFRFINSMVKLHGFFVDPRPADIANKRGLQNIFKKLYLLGFI